MSTELLTPARSRRWDDGSLIVELAHHGLMKVHFVCGLGCGKIKLETSRCERTVDCTTFSTS
jgi:hypothetical protein